MGVCVCVALVFASALTQNVRLHIEVRSDAGAVADATVVANGTTRRTDSTGRTAFDVPPGPVQIVVAKEGFEPETVSIDIRTGEPRAISIALRPQSRIEEHVTVAATRTDKRIEDQPMRVEILDADEIEEKVMMTPGDIVMMLNEMGGLRVQATSPSLGAASVRIQGMRGRYTRFLSDGLPLFGEQAGSFGLLQIPPADLAQVEVVKGVASSLYGAGAMGGVVNLVSKRPRKEVEREALVNRSTRGATDGVLWYSTPVAANWGLTLLAGGHGQQRTDVDGDGWADLAAYARGVVRPRLFWDNHAGATFFATAGVTAENRNGGTMNGAVVPDGLPYREELDTRRVDGGAVWQTLAAQKFVVSVRGSLAHQTQDHTFGDVRERDAHDTSFGEATIRRAIGAHTWVAGIAIERDGYRPRDAPQFRYTFTVPGVFGQDDLRLTSWAALSVGARVDAHSEFGSFVSPRVSALLQRGGWSSRVSIGRGFFTPTPVTEETEAAGLSRLIIPVPLRAERSVSSSVDVTRSAGPLTTTVTLFRSRITDPVDVDRTSAFVMRNLTDAAINDGVELLATWRQPPLSATANYAFVDSDFALTPRHSVSLVGTWARTESGRIGLECYYTGVQRLDANPYRNESRPYIVFGALVERRVGRYRLFLNAENLANVRQAQRDPLLRPARGVDGRWTVDGWAPLDGRNVNGGVRVRF